VPDLVAAGEEPTRLTTRDGLAPSNAAPVTSMHRQFLEFADADITGSPWRLGPPQTIVPACLPAHA
jgi:hypothetical protein